MKKFYSTLIISLLSVNGFTQTYYPMLDSISNSWTFISNLQPVRMQQASSACDYNNFTVTASEYYTTSDTLIGSETYKILERQEYASPFSNCNFGYIREDIASQKVYFMDNVFSPEILLYDFSMQVGDSIQLNFIAQWGMYYVSGYYRLDSIGNITINSGVRRIFYLSNPAAFLQYPLEWIESVGHPDHLVFPYSLNFYGGMMFWCNDVIARDFYQLLTCFEHNSQKVYFDSCSHAFAFNNWCFDYNDSCNYWNICGALEEANPVSNFVVSPNPADELINLAIEANRAVPATVIISDFTGKPIQKYSLDLVQGSNLKPVHLKGLAKGIYLVELQLESRSRFRKIVKT